MGETRPRTRQISWPIDIPKKTSMRRSCLTSKFVWSDQSVLGKVAQKVFREESSHQKIDLWICDISQTSVTCHRICPPAFIQTFLPYHNRSAFLYSAQCSFINSICFWSVRCRRAMIPGEMFTIFSEFQGIVNVNDFWFPLGFQELLQASLNFLWSFCFCTDTPGSIE